MAYKNIGTFIKLLEERGELSRVKTEVDSNLEITEIADRVMKNAGPALLFERVKGSSFPLLINAFGTLKRMALALERDSLDEIKNEVEELLDLSQYMGVMKKVRSLPRLAKLLSVFPWKVQSGPCQEVVEEPDLNTLPVLKCWPGDGGPFITLPLVITKDPETGEQNMGMYRLQVYDKKTTGMHWHLHKDGREIYEKYRSLGGRMPVSVAIGADPATIYAATAPLPKMINEFMFSGFLRRRPLKITKGVTNDLFVPANAEFILEGYVDVDEDLRLEGPFGDHTGYYSLADHYPVFHVEKITRKRRPVYTATIVGKPPMEDCYMGKATERIFLPLLRLEAPEIVDMSFPLEGVFHNCVIVAIKKRYPGHAKKIMNYLWGIGQMMYTKTIVVVDEHVSPADYSTVAWKAFNNIDPKRDLLFSEGPLDALDHASPLAHLGVKLGIDATKKWKSEGHLREWPGEIEMEKKIIDLVDRRWKEYGI